MRGLIIQLYGICICRYLANDLWQCGLHFTASSVESSLRLKLRSEMFMLISLNRAEPYLFLCLVLIYLLTYNAPFPHKNSCSVCLHETNPRLLTSQGDVVVRSVSKHNVKLVIICLSVCLSQDLFTEQYRHDLRRPFKAPITGHMGQVNSGSAGDVTEGPWVTSPIDQLTSLILSVSFSDIGALWRPQCCWSPTLTRAIYHHS